MDTHNTSPGNHAGSHRERMTMTILNRGSKATTLTVNAVTFTKVVNGTSGAQVDVDPSTFSPEGLSKALEYGIQRYLMDGAQGYVARNTEEGETLTEAETKALHVAFGEMQLAKLRGEQPIGTTRQSGTPTIEGHFRKVFGELTTKAQRKGSPKLEGSLATMKALLTEWKPALNVDAIELHAQRSLKAALTLRKAKVKVDLGI